ncbi:MAG: 50S ribosomal protein L11 methyltransferase [Chitinophagaceae bacterium]|nr:50S ribosomal protein L11 methyltransferase [Chitinophagaceae bacterium]
MANYIKIELGITSAEQSEILVAELSEINFYAFVQEDSHGEEDKSILSAFIKEEDFNEEELNEIISPRKIAYTKSIIKETNWNAKWESEFEPIIINDFVAVRAAFHEQITNVKHEIIITPKMSFGTGHHATTYLMLQQMQYINFSNKTVLDFGTGTGILAIMAKISGATKVVAIDNDDWSINNAKENFVANNCTDIVLLKKNTLEDLEAFDIILANINLNVITSSFENLKSISHQSTKLLLSGFLLEDEPQIINNFSLQAFTHKETAIRNGWISLLVIKS